MSKTCHVCERRLPFEVFAPLVTNAGSKEMCAICANDETNRTHGLPKGTPFRGEQAENMRLLALEYLENLR